MLATSMDHLVPKRLYLVLLGKGLNTRSRTSGAAANRRSDLRFTTRWSIGSHAEKCRGAQCLLFGMHMCTYVRAYLGTEVITALCA